MGTFLSDNFHLILTSNMTQFPHFHRSYVDKNVDLEEEINIAQSSCVIKVAPEGFCGCIPLPFPLLRGELSHHITFFSFLSTLLELWLKVEHELRREFIRFSFDRSADLFLLATTVL